MQQDRRKYRQVGQNRHSHGTVIAQPLFDRMEFAEHSVYLTLNLTVQARKGCSPGSGRSYSRSADLPPIRAPSMISERRI